MITRKYSLEEIDEMRWAVAWIRADQTRFVDQTFAHTIIENLLRTYMMAGIEPAELIAAGKKAEEELRKKAAA